MKFAEFLKESLAALRKNPKLFVPNFAMSFLWGGLELLVASFMLRSIGLFSSEDFYTAFSDNAEAQALFFYGSVLLAVIAVAFLLNVLVEGMYPKMIKDYFSRKKISFSAAFKTALHRFPVLLASILISMILPAIILSYLFPQLLFLSGKPLFWVYLALIIALAFAVFFFFYLLMSSAILGKKSLQAVFRESLSLTRKNPLMVSKAASFPFTLSLVGILLAFIASNPAFFVLFWAVKVLIPIVSTYSYVLNPTIYLGLKGELK